LVIGGGRQKSANTVFAVSNLFFRKVYRPTGLFIRAVTGETMVNEPPGEKEPPSKPDNRRGLLYGKEIGVYANLFL
jgi:hypothetical protein